MLVSLGVPSLVVVVFFRRGLLSFVVVVCCQSIFLYGELVKSEADIKMEISVLTQSLKLGFLSSTIFQLNNIFWLLFSA